MGYVVSAALYVADRNSTPPDAKLTAPVQIAGSMFKPRRRRSGVSASLSRSPRPQRSAIWEPIAMEILAGAVDDDRHGASIIHRNTDFETIAAVTGCDARSFC
jgi:hypothetical protein